MKPLILNSIKVRWIVTFVLTLLPLCSFSQSTYDKYTEEAKILTQMEWRLLNVNLELTTANAKVTYNNETDKFECEIWVLTNDAADLSTQSLRSLLLSTTNYSKALLKKYFKNFNSARDFIVNYRLGLEGYGNIAEYKNDRFNFTDEYYNYLREVGN